jgi:hypothetical protein
MSKSLRLSEKWFRRGLWIVAIVFAGFLTGLGNTVVRHLPRVETTVSLDQFMPPETPRLRDRLREANKAEAEVNRSVEQARQQHGVAAADSRTAADSLAAFLATRQVTSRPEQDPEVIARREAVEAAKRTERQALALVEVRQKEQLDLKQEQERIRARLREMEEGARDAFDAARRAQEMRVFLYRLLRRAGPVPARLGRLRPLRGRDHRHRAGRPLGDCGAQPLPGTATRGRGDARRAAPRRALLRRCAGAAGQEGVPGLRAPCGPRQPRERLLPALRHRPLQQVRLRRPQERVRALLPRLRQGGGNRGFRIRRVMPKRAAYCTALRQRQGARRKARFVAEHDSMRRVVAKRCAGAHARKLGRHLLRELGRGDHTRNAECFATSLKSLSVLRSVTSWRMHNCAISASMVPTCTPALRQAFRSSAAAT